MYKRQLEELSGGATEVTAYLVDVGNLDAVTASAAAVLDEVGRVDVLVNNAGIVRGNQYFWESDSARDTQLTVAVNTLAPMYVARAFLPSMISGSGESRLLNLASAAGFTANPRMAVYAASKWAVIGWSDSVSYTHLDVYKRQADTQAPRLEGIVRLRLRARRPHPCISEQGGDDCWFD